MSKALTIHICGPEPMRRIFVKGKAQYFELHSYLGPLMVDRKGDPTNEIWPEDDAFWEAFERWDEQGRKMSRHNTCLYSRTAPRKPKDSTGPSDALDR